MLNPIIIRERKNIMIYKLNKIYLVLIANVFLIFNISCLHANNNPDFCYDF